MKNFLEDWGWKLLIASALLKSCLLLCLMLFYGGHR